MKLYFPGNVYSRLLSENLPEPVKDKVVFLPASSIPNELKKDETAAGLITPTDILSSPEIFISSKMGVSFEGTLSNSYIYFQPGQKDFKSLSLCGDISSIEVILSKIFFKESYNSDIIVEILSDLKKAAGKNILATGDINFTALDFNSGLSFAEEMIDMFSLPYVNFVLGSYNSRILEDIHKACRGISQKIYDAIEHRNFGTGLAVPAKEYIRENAASIIYEFEDQDIDDIHQLLHMPYFYGIIQDLVEPKFV